MGLSEIRLIVSDWDGTLGGGGGGKVPWDIHAIAELADIISVMRSSDKYPPLILCTGKSVTYVEAAIQAIGAFFDIPSICENGGIFYYPKTKKVTWHPLLTEDSSKLRLEVRSEVSKIIKEMGGVIELGNEVGISVIAPQGADIALYYEVFREKLLNRFPINITHSKSAINITPKGVDKGTALEHVSKLTGIPLKNMLGIGDTKSDLPILTRVGVATGPSNATEDIKPILKYVSLYPKTKGVIDILTHFVPGLNESYSK